MRNRFALYLTMALAVAVPTVRAQSAPDAYFQVGFEGYSDTFVVRLTDAARIQTARNILSGTETQARHISGIIVKSLAFYNPPWTYHLDPNSISFFSFAIEVCDGAPDYLQQHLSEVGGALLPGNRWCPWSSKLLRELPRPPAADRAVTVVSAATYGEMAIAPDSIVTAFGSDLSPTIGFASGIPLPISLEGVQVRVLDSSGRDQLVPLYAVTPNQVNFVLPSDAAPGVAVITVIAADGRRFSANIYVQPVVPGLFSGPDGWIVGLLIRIGADGSRDVTPMLDGSPVTFGPEGERLFLEMYGTGFRNAAAGKLTVFAQDTLPLLYAGAQAETPGLDQINVELPRSLAGAGPVRLSVVVEAAPGRVESNEVKILFR